MNVSVAITATAAVDVTATYFFINTEILKLQSVLVSFSCLTLLSAIIVNLKICQIWFIYWTKCIHYCIPLTYYLLHNIGFKM